MFFTSIAFFVAVSVCAAGTFVHAAALPKITGWKKYTNKTLGYSINIPKNWDYVREFEGGVHFGMKERSQHGDQTIWTILYYRQTDAKIDDLIQEMGNQLKKRKMYKTKIKVGSLTGTRVVVMTPKTSKWYYESIALKANDHFFIIGNGTIKDARFKQFYSSFTSQRLSQPPSFESGLILPLIPSLPISQPSVPESLPQSLLPLPTNEKKEETKTPPPTDSTKSQKELKAGVPYAVIDGEFYSPEEVAVLRANPKIYDYEVVDYKIVLTQEAQPYVLKSNEVLKAEYNKAVEPARDFSQEISSDIIKRDLSDDEQLELNSGPTLGMSGPSTIFIEWQTNRPSLSWVTYGTAREANEGEYKSAEYKKKHKIVLKNLKPQTKYYYLLHLQDESGGRGETRGFIQKTSNFSYDFSDGGEAVDAETGGLEVNLGAWEKPSYSSRAPLDAKIVNEPGVLQRAIVTAYPTKIKVEYRKLDSPIQVIIEDREYVPGKNYRVISRYDEKKNRDTEITGTDLEIGPTDLYGYRDETNGSKLENTSTEAVRSANTIEMKGLTPGKAYHLRFKSHSDLQYLTASYFNASYYFSPDSTITTPAKEGEELKYSIPLLAPKIKKLYYPKDASHTFVQLMTDNPAYVTIEYGSLERKGSKYLIPRPTQRQMSVHADTKHTFHLDNIIPGETYRIKILVGTVPQNQIHDPRGGAYLYDFHFRI